MNEIHDFMNYCILKGFTAVHMAAQGDNHEAIRLLVDLTFNKCKREEEERLAAEEDGNNGNRTEINATLDSVSLDESHNEEDSMTYIPSITDVLQNKQVVAFLNQPSRNLTTPLHVAVLNNAMGVIDLLLSMQVRVDFKDSSGDTALHKAGRIQLNSAYQVLLAAGASQSVKNNFGETPRDLLIDNPTY